MKKILLASAFVGLACSSFAQGSFNVRASLSNQAIKLPDGVSNITAAQGSWMISVLTGSTTLLSPATLVFGQPGRIANGTEVVVPGSIGGSVVSLTVRVWAGAATWEQAQTSGSYVGTVTWNQTIGGAIPGSPALSVPNMTAMPGFTVAVVPEPATMALAGIGGLALLGLRRKTA